MSKILIVEDDKKLRNELKIFLEKNGYEVQLLEDFENPIENILSRKVDLILLDINLPNVDGTYICKEIRKTSNVPIIMVTSRESEIDELISLNNGADQYVTKPFNILILLAKISGLLRRTQEYANINQNKIDCKDFILNISKSVIEKDDTIIELTKNELKILHYLVLKQGQIVSRDEIINYLWDSESFIDDNTLTVNMTRLRGKLDSLDEKYLISELLLTPSFEEGKILKEVLQDTDKSMLENVNKYKYIQEDYKEYIELWIHEIKMPIATSKMIIENNKNQVTESINEELNKIENYIEQALFYARSNTVEKDYYIKRANLKEIVNNAILKNKDSLLQNKIELNIHDLEQDVYTDSKWCVFILNQIIQNSIKYSKKEDKKIEIYSVKKKEKIVLYIKDNGIGIKKGEITRVFEKGFTGENGRITGQKSTGIGLYLCKKLCNRLEIGLELNSEQNIGTEVRIIFPKSSFSDIK